MTGITWHLMYSSIVLGIWYIRTPESTWYMCSLRPKYASTIIRPLLSLSLAND